jgi:hypothetical protein
MRCYLMKGGHILSAKELSLTLSDEEAVEQCRLVFESKPEAFDDFEVWLRERKIYQHSLDRGLSRKREDGHRAAGAKPSGATPTGIL